MRVLIPIIALAFVSCALQTSLSESQPFKDQIGVELTTERVTYIYDFSHSPQSLWNHTFKYGRAGEDGEFRMYEGQPKAQCPPESIVVLDEVHLRKAKSGEAIEALGTIHCEGSQFRFRYVWGSGRERHAAPWESEKYEPRNTRKVL